MRELLRELRELYVRRGFLKDRFEDFQTALTKYEKDTGDGNYNYYLDDIITETDAVEKISELYSIDDINEYINGQSSCDLYQTPYGQLEEYDDNCFENTLEEIIEDLEERIKLEINMKIIEEIKNFNSKIINNDIQCTLLTDDYAVRLGDALCNKFEFKERENKVEESK